VRSPPRVLRRAGDPLLSQDAEGSFEDDPDVGWEDTDDSVTFTATDALAAELDGYVCTVHPAMEGGVQTTAETEDDLVIAGLDTFNATELDGEDVAIPVADTGGFPGEHVAHVIPIDDLSGEYGPGDTVSAETAGAVLDNEGATVFQGTVEFEDQTFEEPIEEGEEVIEVATADLLDGAGGDTEFVVDLHPTDDEGNLVGGEFLGASDVLAGQNEDVTITTERFPEDGEFNEFPLTGTDDVVAMFHLVDDDAEPGDPASPGSYPLLQHGSADGFVAGGVTDDGTYTVAEDTEAALAFGDQATASSTFTDDEPTVPGVVVEDVESEVDSAVVVTYEDGDDLVVAGLDTFDAAELDGDDVVIPVTEFGGFPGEHVAHIIPTADLSGEYEPGDTVSGETAGAVLVNEGATVFQGIVEFDDQNYEDAADEVVADVAALVGDEDALFQVDLHATDEDGGPADFVGSSPVLPGVEDLDEEPPTDVPIFLQDTDGAPIEFTESDEYVAMFHIVDDDDAEPGDLFPPGTFPVLQNADAIGGFVPGGVTDDGEVGIFSAEGAELDFGDQAVGIDESGDVVVFVDDIVEAEQVEQDVSDPGEDFVVVYEGEELTQDSLVDFRNVGDAEDGELLLRVGDADPGTHTVELFADARSEFDPGAEAVDHPFITDERTEGETTDETSYILLLEDDLSAPVGADRGTVVEELQSQAVESQRPVVEDLESMGLAVDSQFWLVNAVTTTVEGDVSSAQLEAIDGVEHVVKNVEYQLPRPTGDDGGVSVQSVAPQQDEFTYGLEQIDVPGFEETFDTQGEGSTVAILDDGISTPDDPHPDLDIAIEAIAADGEVTTGTLGAPGAHGEHVAGTATGAAEPEGPVPRYGVAPEADLIKINVFEGGALTADLIAAIEFSVENDAEVASMSLGFSPVDGLSPVQLPMEAAMQNANDAGTIVIGSAGNEGSGADGGPVTSPGSEFTGFSIGASNEAGGIAGFSSGAVVSPNTAFVFDDEFNPAPYPEHYPRTYVKPDVTAPGAAVLSAGPLGPDVTPEPPVYSFASGTSMAAPHAAGAVALAQSATDTEHAPKTIENALAETAEKPAEAPGAVGERDIRYGTGIINVTAATLALEETTTVSGTVTDAETGTELTGVHITTDTGVVTSTQDGEYSIDVTADVEEVAVTADEFGFTAATETVPVDGGEQTVDFALDPEVDVELLVDQPAFAEFQDTFDVVVDVRNLEEYTVELADAEGVTEDDIDVFLGETPVEFGEPVDLDGISGDGVAVTVEIDGAFEEGDQFALDHTFGGPGEDIAVTTGPTQLTEDQAPAEFGLTDFDAPDSQPDPEEPVEYVPSVTVTNTGQTPGAAEVRWFAGPLGLAGDNPIVDLEPGESETVALNFGELDFAAIFGAEVELLHGFDAAPVGPEARGDLTFDRFSVGGGFIPLLEPIDEFQPRGAAETADVFAADVTIEDQSFDEQLESVNIALSSVVPDEEYVVVLHEDTDGLPVLGNSGDLTGEETDLTIDLDEPITERTDVVAMLHFAEEGAEFGAPITAFDAAVDGPAPVTDRATLGLAQNLTFEDQFVDEMTVEATGVDADGVESAVVLTYEEAGDLVIAGLTVGTFEDEPVGIEIEDNGGLVGEHTAHIIPAADLSGEYKPGDTVSPETADAVQDAETGDVQISFDGEQAAVDTTGDGNLNDLTGDGFDIVDVQTLFDNLDDTDVQANADLFDFAGLDDERVSIFDVQGLFTELQAETSR